MPMSPGFRGEELTVESAWLTSPPTTEPAPGASCPVAVDRVRSQCILPVRAFRLTGVCPVGGVPGLSKGWHASKDAGQEPGKQADCEHGGNGPGVHGAAAGDTLDL